MRLTLRTLLAYLDDTLEPAQAKIIGQKVAESDQARELMEHIKQVTRRRRITAPPTSGPGSKIDPNTIAEYLDGAVSAEQASEVEQVCLASDVHLAEIAACHQILALVLGQPALVPPTAKSRMYGLVKGPESIPFRRPGNLQASADADFGYNGDDIDETLRMGVPFLGDRSKWSHVLLLIGAGIMVSILLFLAISHVLKLPAPDVDNQDKGNAAVNPQNGSKEKDKDKDGDRDKGKGEQVDPNKKPDVPKGKGNPREWPDLPPPTLPTETPPHAKKNPGKLPEYVFNEANNKTVEIGRYLTPPALEASVVVSRPVDKGDWVRLWGNKVKVEAGRTYVALPGFRGDLDLNTGVKLTLFGNLPEIVTLPFAESVVDLHSHYSVDVDLTLRNGRIILTSTADKPTVVRVRFENPDKPDKAEIADLLLQDQGAQVFIDRVGTFPSLLVPFSKDPKSPTRVLPTAFVAFWVAQGNVTIRIGNAIHQLEGPSDKPGPPRKMVLKWSNKSPIEVEPISALPDYVSLTPPPNQGFDKNDKKIAADLVKARDELSDILKVDKAVLAGLTEILRQENLGRRVLAVRSYAALGDLDDLIDVLVDARQADTFPFALETLRNWIATSRDNEYKLFDRLQKSKRYTVGAAVKVMELFHGFVNDDLLLEYLDNSNIVVRKYAHMYLKSLYPPGQAIPYEATMDPEMRRMAQQRWSDLIRKIRTAPKMN